MWSFDKFINQQTAYQNSFPFLGASPEYMPSLKKLLLQPDFVFISTIKPKKWHPAANNALKRLSCGSIDATILVSCVIVVLAANTIFYARLKHFPIRQDPLFISRNA